MTADILAAAVAIREKRAAQIAQLSGRVAEACQRANELRDRKRNVREAGKRRETVRGFFHVKGFFPTPPPLVARMIDAADLSPGMACLEPSAGTGNIVRAICAAGCTCTAVEIVPAIADLLRADGFNVQTRDFLTLEPGPRFDRVIMNPPYGHRQDEAHTRHAYKFLAPGGRLVSLVSSMTGARLEAWAGECGGYVEQLGGRHFLNAERSTGVNVALVVIDR